MGQAKLHRSVASQELRVANGWCTRSVDGDPGGTRAVGTAHPSSPRSHELVVRTHIPVPRKCFLSCKRGHSTTSSPDRTVSFAFFGEPVCSVYESRLSAAS